MRAAVAACALLLGACGSGSGADGPDDAVSTFLETVADGDCEGVRELVVTPSELDCSTVDGLRQLAGGLDAESVEVASQDGSSAVVTVTFTSGESDFEVEKVQGVWLVRVDSDV